MLRRTVSGISAGILISIGGCVYLACTNKYVGAILFSVALLCICYKGYGLFTGKVGFLPERCDRDVLEVLFAALLGNAVGTFACGYAVRYGIPALGEAAEMLCQGKLDGQSFPQTLLRAVLCGVLMYLAVSIFRDQKTPLGILFCIPVFILSGFEHSIADCFYFAASGIVSWRACGFLWTVILGNALGGVLLPLLQKIGKQETKKS